MDILSQLKSNPHNPRSIRKEEFDRLVKSIRTFPQMLEKRPIVYDENFIVVGGNMRLKALKQLQSEGFEIKDTYFHKAEGWTDEQKRQFVIRDNISDGVWDYDLIANEWTDLPLADWGLSVPYMGEVANIEKIHGQDTEWVGMPEFDPADSPPKIVINFDSEQAREEFVRSINLKISIKLSKTWTTWVPYREKEDPSSLKYE